MKIKTLVPQIKDTYSSFPTFTEHDGKIFVFYRQSVKSDIQCHGIEGKVRCFEIDKELFLKMFENDNEADLYSFGKDYTVFESENEIDAIVSRLGENTFSLCTRTFMKNLPVRTYISVSDTPHFKERHEVKIKGAEWMVFYGKAFKWDQGFVFPAYGDLKGERPMLLITDDFRSWDVLSLLPANLSGMALNESSVVFDSEKYIIFMREDTGSFGIWYSTSHDLQSWTAPEKLISFAQAPMSVCRNGRIFLTFREFLDEDKAAVSLMSPFSDTGVLTIETYNGDPYDGGYTDIGFIDDRMFIVYYTGNECGEPYLRICEACSDTDLKNLTRKQNEKFIAL